MVVAGIVTNMPLNRDSANESHTVRIPPPPRGHVHERAPQVFMKVPRWRWRRVHYSSAIHERRNRRPKGQRFLVDASLSDPSGTTCEARRPGMKDLQTWSGGWCLLSLFDYLGPGPETTLLSRRSIGGDVSDRYAVLEAVLGPNDRIRSRLNAASVKPSRTDVFTRPKTRKNPRVRSTKDPLSAALTDSTTWRLPIEMRQAVVP